jgi:hypothetical protein
MLLPSPSNFSAWDKEGNDKGGKSNGDGNEEGNGDGCKRDGVGGGQSDVAPNQMAQQMAEPGNVAQAPQSDVATNQMAQQMAEPGDMARAPIKIVRGKPWSPGV